MAGMSALVCSITLAFECEFTYMTPQKRPHQLPEDEQPSETPQEPAFSEASVEQATQNDAFAPGSQPDEELPEEQIPSFPVDNGPGEPVFDFPLPTRLASDEPIRPPASRRRRRPNRLMMRPDINELGERLESMARRAAPTFDFFFFSILAGAILGLGYMLDSPAVLLFGILVAPILAPWVGVALGAATGETRFLGQVLGGFLTALIMVFLTGILAGLAIRIWMPVYRSGSFACPILGPRSVVDGHRHARADRLFHSIGRETAACQFNGGV
jgi:hypothetical protein